MCSAASTAIVVGNRHNSHDAVKFFFTAVFHCLENLFAWKLNLEINILSDRLVHEFFQLRNRFHRNFTAEIHRDVIRIHVESNVFKFIFLMNEAGENMLASMILHIVKTAFPIDFPNHCRPNFQRLVYIVNNLWTDPFYKNNLSFS